MKWAADDWERTLSIDLLLPAGWSTTVRIGDGLSGWKVLVNGVPQ